MAWTRDFRASTIVIDSNNVAAKNIRGITSSSGRTNAEIMREISSQNVYADTQTLAAIKPTFSFTTVDIRGAIDGLGLLGMCILADGDDEGLAIYTQQQDCSGVKAGSVHDKYLIKKGVVVPRQLSVDHRGNCQLTYEVYAVTDGSNAPVIYTQNQALPAVASTPVGRWTMREMSVGGVDITGKRNVSIDFGATVTQEGADSEQYDSVSSLESVVPKVSVRGVDASWFGGVTTLLGGAATLANTVFQLQKRGVAIGTASHILLAFNGLVTLDTLFDASPNAPAETSLNIDLQYDGTNAPATYTLDTVLT